MPSAGPGKRGTFFVPHSPVVAVLLALPTLLRRFPASSPQSGWTDWWPRCLLWCSKSPRSHPPLGGQWPKGQSRRKSKRIWSNFQHANTRTMPTPPPHLKPPKVKQPPGDQSKTHFHATPENAGRIQGRGNKLPNPNNHQEQNLLKEGFQTKSQAQTVRWVAKGSLP